MTVDRHSHTATLLSNGKVLVAGGYNSRVGPLTSAELFDPTTGAWAATDAMTVDRQSHTATLLSNGHVLITGGWSGNFAPLGSAELYDVDLGTWTATGSMTVDRYLHTATPLSSGKVLVAGGYSSVSGYLATTELYDPAAGVWTVAGSMTVDRNSHTAAPLANGKVLVAGGTSSIFGPLSSAELYDPISDSWAATVSMTVDRYNFAATPLSNGKVMVTAGYSAASGSPVASAELYEVVFIADTTPPTVTLTASADTYTTEQNVRITCSATDDESGVVSTDCESFKRPAYMFDIGLNTVRANATDAAGNTGSAKVHFTVSVTTPSLIALTDGFVVNRNAANSLDAKLRLAQAAGDRGNPRAKAALIAGYVAELRGLPGSLISSDNAATLIRLAAYL